MAISPGAVTGKPVGGWGDGRRSRSLARPKPAGSRHPCLPTREQLGTWYFSIVSPGETPSLLSLGRGRALGVRP